MENYLTVQSLVKNYGLVRALAGVSTQIPKGQSLAIMGPSGSGKSTLLHCLSGILRPDSGQVILAGQDITALSDAARSELRLKKFGFVFQDGQLIPELSARENVALPLMLTGVRRQNALNQADAWLAKLGLASQTKRLPGQLSGGQVQRVAIARAMVHNPEIVFADEPTGALDQTTGHQVMQLLTTTTQMSNTTLIVVTHDINVANWCERLIEIRDAMIHADQALAGESRA